MVGHSENDMIMTHGQCALHQLVNPEGLSGCLAFGTMPIATTVIAITNQESPRTLYRPSGSLPLNNQR
jgi:hypothetical protein